MPKARVWFRVTTHDETGAFVTDAMMGPHSLAMEIEYLRPGWKLTVVRVPQEGEVSGSE